MKKKIQKTYGITQKTIDDVKEMKEITGIAQSVIVENGIKKELKELRRRFEMP